jgi:arginyl-tRNA synthetase
MDLWKRMNSWVYEGFDTTYKKIGSDFAKTYYESKLLQRFSEKIFEFIKQSENRIQENNKYEKEQMDGDE